MQRPAPAQAVRTPGSIQVDVKPRHGSEKHLRKPVQPVEKLARASTQWMIKRAKKWKYLGTKNCAYSWSDPGSWGNVNKDAGP